MTPSTTRLIASIPEERSVSEGSLSFRSLRRCVSLGTTCLATEGNSSNNCGRVVRDFGANIGATGRGVVDRGKFTDVEAGIDRSMRSI